ncbi:hypothetical protein tpqmel_0292 [Candidatus Gastranaerophilus sp. (ex Termes propinquus)]|nr:hypothetical protein tpqmel_0292 [Candidatus Gastranaerophilus sp. (ex Termes propinquus)]
MEVSRVNQASVYNLGGDKKAVVHDTCGSSTNIKQIGTDQYLVQTKPSRLGAESKYTVMTADELTQKFPTGSLEKTPSADSFVRQEGAQKLGGPNVLPAFAPHVHSVAEQVDNVKNSLDLLSNPEKLQEERAQLKEDFKNNPWQTIARESVKLNNAMLSTVPHFHVSMPKLTNN